MMQAGTEMTGAGDKNQMSTNMYKYHMENILCVNKF